MKPYQMLVNAAREAIDNQRANIKAARQNRALINRTCKAMQKSGDGRAPYCFFSCGRIYISVAIYGLDGFRDAKLVKALERIEKASGLQFLNSRDYAESGQREYRADNDLLHVELSAILGDAPKNCRKVVKSVTMKEVKEYELVCS